MSIIEKDTAKPGELAARIARKEEELRELRGAYEAWREKYDDNPLPDHIRLYSVVTYPEPDRVSWALKNSYLLLGENDIRNDTQVIVFDQMIPGSSVMAVVNGDHWAIAVPVARSHPLAGGTLIFLAGLFDDRRGLSPVTRFIVQVVACLVMVYHGNAYLLDFGRLFTGGVLERLLSASTISASGSAKTL